MSREFREWLTFYDLEHLATVFEQNDIDLDIIAELTDGDLKELGLNLGSRKRLKIALVELRKQAAKVLPGSSEIKRTGLARKQAERRQLTVMFCDLVGSTALSVEFDPEDLRDVIASYRQECADVIKHYGGFIGHYGGDGMLVYFGYPIANEYDAANSVWAGMEIVRRLASSAKLPLEVRVGIATGTVVAGDLVAAGTEERNAVVGQTPNLAARLMSLAEPGSVLVSEQTKQLLGDMFAVESLGEHKLKGFSNPIPVWRAVALRKAHSRSEVLHTRQDLLPLVARDAEIEHLLSCWTAAKTGRGRAVLISGEAGIGKSHLVRHFRDQIQAFEQDVDVKHLFCSPNHTNSSFYPLVSLMSEHIGISADYAIDLNRDKIEEYCNKNNIVNDDVKYCLHTLLHVGYLKDIKVESDEIRRIQIELITNFLFHLKTNIVIIAEDLHWSDPSTREFFGNILQNNVEDAGVLILFTFRDGFYPSWPTEHFMSNVKLNRLDIDEAVKLINLVSGEKTIPADLVDEIISKADRIPLFIEEVCRETCERLDRSEIEPRTMDGDEVRVPSSLSDSLMARLDRLNKAKYIAQVAATIGGSFSNEMIAKLMRLDQWESRKLLDQLVESNVLCHAGLTDTASYVFRHALFQDVAYSSLLRRERERLHSRIARMLIKTVPGVAEREPEFIALHCAKGGLIEEAVDHWQTAAERSRQQSANSEVMNHVKNGLELLAGLPDTEENIRREMDLRIYLALAIAALKGGGAPEVGENYSRARQLIQPGSDRKTEFKILHGSWVYHFIGADLHQASVLSTELLEIANQIGDDALLVEANRAHGQTLLYQGEFAKSQQHIKSALDHHNPQRHGLHALRYGLDPKICCVSYLSHNLMFLAQSQKAIEVSDQAVVEANKLGHPYTRAFTHAFAAFLHQQAGNRSETAEMAAASIDISRANEFQFWQRQQTIFQIWASNETWEDEHSIEVLKQAVDVYLEMEPVLEATRVLCLMANVYLRHGYTFCCLAMLNRAVHMATNTGERFYLAEIYRLRGEAEMISANHRITKAAHENFSQALAIAHEQGALVWQVKTLDTLRGINDTLNKSSAQSASKSPNRRIPSDNSDSGTNFATGLELLNLMARHG